LSHLPQREGGEGTYITAQNNYHNTTPNTQQVKQQIYNTGTKYKEQLELCKQHTAQAYTTSNKEHR
jgi:hypothetical protein